MSIRFLPILLATTLPSCFLASREEQVGSGKGTLVIEWTVHGVRDPDRCVLGNADTIDLTVSRADRSFELKQSCSQFATSLDLDAARYSGGAVLVTPTGANRTTQVALGVFTVYGNDVVTIPVDFPASAFY